MKTKRFISSLLSLAMILSLFPNFGLHVHAEGTRTISSLAELTAFRDEVNAGTYLGERVELVADIDLEGSETNQWTPIGSNSNEFKGEFDGGGHKITGLYINNTSNHYQGLFGYIGNGAEIKNLGVAGEVSGTESVGGIAGCNNGGTITNCYNTGTVRGESYVGGIAGIIYDGTVANCYNTGTVRGDNYVGGIVGYTYNKGGTITNCYNTGKVSGEDGLGGIVGYNDGGTITNCYNTGTVSGNSDVGGIAGANAGIITNCYNTGIVSRNIYVGGIVGWNSVLGTVTNCYNTGTVSGSSSVGGIAGCGDGPITNCYYLKNTADGGINGSDATGQAEKITADELKTETTFLPNWDFTSTWVMDADFHERPLLRNNMEGNGLTEATAYKIYTVDDLKKLSEKSQTNDFSGKYFELMDDIDLKGSATNQWTPIGSNSNEFKGEFDGGGHKITGLYINDNTSYDQGLFGCIGDGAEIKNLGVAGEVSGYNNVGGIVGWNEGTVTNCYNTGTVSGDNSVGGIVGTNNRTVTNCYNTGKVSGDNYVGGIVGYTYNKGGTITNCYNTGKVSGEDGLGGIVGANVGIITNCYNTGTVSGDSNVGGIVGENGGSTTDCYYLAETADGGITGSDATGQAEEIDADELKDKTSFSNWDFTSTWVMDADFHERPLLVNNMEGNGLTEATAYKIYTVDDLKKLAKKTNDGNSFSGKYFELMNDIDLEGSETNQWTPIGNNSKMFRGKFNGGGYKITGLYINNRSNYQGLFGYIGDGVEIKNLGVAGEVSGSLYVGGIVGYTYNKGGTITNCYNTGTVRGDSCVGGIVGYTYNKGGTITNCYNTGNVSGIEYVGGIIGNSASAVTTITDCYNTGMVSGNELAGGIVGRNAGTVTNCYNTGKVSGEGNVGGIVGRNERTVTNCYNTGTVRGNGAVGGIVGTNNGTVTNCYNTGKVSGNEFIGGIVGYNADTTTNCYYLAGTADGGINGSDADGQAEVIAAEQLKDKTSFSNWDFTSTWVMDTDFHERPLLVNNMEGNGLTEATAYKIYTVDDLKKLSAKSQTNDFNGKYFELMNDIKLNGSETNQWTPIGNESNEFKGEFDGGGHKITGLYINNNSNNQGLFGCIGNGAEIKNLGVAGTVSGSLYVGGIVGYNNRGTITNCYNIGKVSGNEFVGGIVGVNSGPSVTTTNCYNTGTVSGESYVGGIVGWNGGLTTNCYYLAGTADGGIAESDDTANNVVGKEEEEFKNGIVAYLLQGTQNEQIWGQRLKGNNTDQYPVLSSDAEDKVYKISFMKRDGTDYVLHTEAGANADGMKTLPGFDSDVYDFKKWVQGADPNAEEFNENTAVTADMTVYAVGEEITAATAEKDYVIEMTYGEAVSEINLSDYVENKSGAADNFTFTLANGSELPQGLTLSGGKINGTPTKVGTVEVEFTVTNNSGIMLMSLGYENEKLTLQLKVNKGSSSVETQPTANNDLVYNGEPLALLKTPGTAQGGTLKYSLDQTNWYDFNSLPGVKDAKDDYKVWYKVVGDENHNDTTPVCIENIKIEPLSVNDADITLGTALTYNRAIQTQTVKEVTVGELKLTENDYTVSDNTGKDAGTNYNLTITGKGNFKGSTTKAFEIAKLKVEFDWQGTSNVYDGNVKTVSAIVTNKGDDTVNLALDGTTSATDVDVYEAIITGVDNSNYTIEGISDNDLKKTWSIALADDNEISGLFLEDWIYGENPKIPTAMAKYGTPRFVYCDTKDGTYTDTPMTENTNAGTYWVKATVDGTQNYAEVWSEAVSFTISPKPVTATIANIADQTYTGRAIEPQITVYDDDGTTVISDTEYTVGYSNNIDAGTATVTLTDNADGNYTVSGSKDFTIAKKSIENATLSLDGELTYNGQPQTQNVTLTLNGFTNVTFDISDNEQTDVKTNGKYTLIVTGTVNFEGTKTLDWNIKPYTPTEKPDNKTTASVRRGRTLAEATVTEGEILGINDTVLEGTFAWVDDTKAISADGTEQMTFTPTNTNYAPVTIDVVVSTYSSGGGGTSRYTVKFDTDGGNAITNQTVTKNSKATEPTKPTKEGYIFDGWYTDSKFTTEYDFDTKVTKNITLYAKWVIEDEVQEPSDDKKDDEQKPTTDEWKNPFTDVTKVDWFFDNIRYANENGLMSGVTSTTFAPNDSLSRAMLVTVLWRAEGEPVVNYAMLFTDIVDTAYYAEAVRWAASENIVNGVTETEFAPDENITREQIAAIIYRYAKYKGYDVSVGENTNILSYTDFDEISEYAIKAIQYAVGSGLINGKTESTLNQKDNATRAEIAAILQRFIEGNK